jgi:hypothetical protein
MKVASDALLACPFCGSPAFQSDMGVSCVNQQCGAFGMRAHPLEWNRRAVTSDADLKRERDEACKTLLDRDVLIEDTFAAWRMASGDGMQRCAVRWEEMKANHRSERPSTRSGDAMTTETTHARVGGTLNPLLARLVEYVNTVEEALMQTEVGRNAWPRYAERLREAGEALKRECANTKLTGGLPAKED